MNTAAHCQEHGVDLGDPELHYAQVPHQVPPFVATHYHVVENTPGYLPDSDPEMFSSLRSAVAYAAGLARELREDGYHGRTAFLRDRSGYLERDSRDLGRSIEILSCCELACSREAIA